MNIDFIVCINLQERYDRYKKSLAVFQRLQLPVVYFHPKLSDEGGNVGCFRSHMEVIKIALEQNARHVMIFEDDILPTPSAPSFMNSMYFFDTLNAHPNIEYLQLGYSVLPHESLSYMTSKRLSNHLIRYNGNLAHAYILNRTGMTEVLKAYHMIPSENLKYMDVDVFYKDFFQARGTGACLIPQLFIQDFCNTSNNVIPKNLYYDMMRNLSCFSTRSMIFYTFSLMRFYAAWIFVITLILVYLILRQR